MSSLRPYQKECHDAAMEWIRKSTDACMIEAATGAGKSHIISALADSLHKASGGKHVLCLAPNSDLIHQNRDKYLATGNPASIYSSSAGQKCLKHKVVFATPGTFKSVARSLGGKFCAVIIDECHGVTPTIKAIIDRMKSANSLLRVCGLSATPFRLGDGYIYAMDEGGTPMGEHSCKNPYFTKKVHTVPARKLIDQGYLTKPVIGVTGGDSYDTDALEMTGSGKWKQSTVDRAFVGQGRKTAAIVSDVVQKSVERKGVMLFAATVQHAMEIMDSLPPAISRMIGGNINTAKHERKKLVSDFKARKFKYLVSVQTMTTGVDFTHVDAIAILRATESVSLLQQIIGRGLRIDDDKDDCLVLDYAENLERHCPDGDIFNPEIKAGMASGEASYIEAECAECGITNTFSARKNPDQFEVDKYGYFVDLAGARIETDSGPMPAHYGRRCQGLVKRGATHVQCAHRWTSKECPHCGADNDIAAKYCVECWGEIIDPNEKLRIEFKEFKKDPTRIQTDRVVSWETKPVVSRKGNECLVVTFQTEYRSFSVWYHPCVERGRLRAEYLQLMDATESAVEMPETVTYVKDGDSGFYRVFDFNRQADEI